MNNQFQHEVIVPNQDLPFKLFAFEGEAGNYRREKHWHNSIEIFAVWDGQLTFELPDKKQTLRAGEFVIVNTNEIHAIAADEANRTVVVQIPIDQFKDFMTQDEFIWFSHGNRDVDHRVFVLLHEMKIKYDQNDAASVLQVLSMYYELMYLLVTQYRKQDIDESLLVNTKQLKKLRKITSYIKKHYNEDLTLSSVAAEFGYAPTYLSRMFQKYAGINFKDYLSSVRLERAVEELERTNGHIVDVALNNGFPNSKAFTAAYKKRFGKNPKKGNKSENNNESS
ncbi:MAG: helix-turn-helix transcriptional regulator [Pseudobutyrivibrio sp.]|nr:helix-turn-helix transcriptional regulator [Pseudobutyrivibrio sp.]